MKRVLELGQIVAGPTAGLVFADMGFEVIKIETPGPGDVARELSGSSINDIYRKDFNTIRFSKGKYADMFAGTKTGHNIMKSIIETGGIPMMPSPDFTVI